MDYAPFVKKLNLPDGRAAPAQLTYDDLVASAISRAHLQDDVRGINASIALIQQTRGAPSTTRTGTTSAAATSTRSAAAHS